MYFHLHFRAISILYRKRLFTRELDESVELGYLKNNYPNLTSTLLLYKVSIEFYGNFFFFLILTITPQRHFSATKLLPPALAYKQA